MTFFQFFTCTVLCVFLTLLGTVVIIAYTRPSGATGLSMAKIQELREKKGT